MPFTDYINRSNESEAVVETQQTDDCCSLSFFQKYNISYPNYFEDDEKRNMRTTHATTKDLERQPSPLFYDEVVLQKKFNQQIRFGP